jgi:hypothetical protein
VENDLALVYSSKYDGDIQDREEKNMRTWRIVLLMLVSVLFAMKAEAKLLDNNNGTVTDKNTGLMWQKCSAGQNNDGACSGTAGEYNWYEATGNVCKGLRTGGHSDWRLPSKSELVTIVDLSAPQSGPTINPSYFPGTIKAGYWSSTADASKPDLAWLVDFVKGYVIPAVNKKNHWYVRCVRTGQ